MLEHPAMRPIALTPHQQRRLELLAKAASRTPQAMMRFVLRDGFEYTEDAVKRAKAGIADADRGRTISHAHMGREMRALIERRGRRRRKAA